MLACSDTATRGTSDDAYSTGFSGLWLCLLAILWAGCSQTAKEEQHLAAIERAGRQPSEQAANLQPTAENTAPASKADAEPDSQRAAGVETQQTDPTNTAERVLLLLPDGPLIIELQITVDGHPLRELREELVSEMLALADRDHDGRPTWGEVFADPKRIFGLLQADLLQLANRKDFMKANDTNRNGLVDRNEARRFLGTVKRSEAALSIESAVDFHVSGAHRSIVRRLLDTDGDSVLDRRELTSLEPRLLSRDANDDRIVTWTELGDSLAGDELANARQKSKHRYDAVAMPVGATANWQTIVDSIQQNYFDTEPVPASLQMLLGLDADGDRRLTEHELYGLGSVEPDAVIAVAFNEAEKEHTVPRLTLEKLSPRLNQLDLTAREQIAVFSPADGFRIRFIIDEGSSLNDRWPSAEAKMAALDANRNGYLEQNETTGAFGSKTFGDVDGDADGKVSLPELTADWVGRRPTQLSGVYALLAREEDVVFSLLDTNHDGRLTTRELHGGTKVLTGFDVQPDGRVTAEELPEALVIVLGRGQALEQPLLTRADVPGETADAAPTWFKFMDANGDAEISSDEFPGGSDRFSSLDLNRDGFITPDEAQRANAASHR